MSVYQEKMIARSLLFFVAFLVAVLISQTAKAEVPQLQNLSMPNVDDAFKTFGAAMNFRPNEPASSWSDVFGVAVGVEGHMTPTRKLGFIGNSSGIPKYLPDAHITGVIQAPLGLSAELGFFPKKTVKDFSLEQYAANIKWTINKVLFTFLPFDVAVRFGMTSGKLFYKQSISGIPVRVDFTQRLINYSLLISKQLWIFEPFFGAGFVNQKADLSAEADGAFYLLGVDVSTYARNSISQSRTVPHFYAGLQTHLWVFDLTFEDDYQFGLNNFAGKIGLKF